MSEGQLHKIDIKDISSKIGYGHGITIGFTDDGAVWMCADSKDPEGRPTMSVFTWSPDMATQIATDIADAAKSAKKAGKFKKEEMLDGGSDSNRAN